MFLIFSLNAVPWWRKNLAHEEEFPISTPYFPSPIAFHVVQFGFDLFIFSLPLIACYLIASLYSLTLHLYPVPLIRYVLLVDMFLSRVQISSFSLLNLFPAYVLFCQLFRDLVNICTERPVSNQPVGISSLCVNWNCPVSLCMCVHMGSC